MSVAQHESQAVTSSTGARVGFWLAIASAAAFGVSGSLAKSLLETGWSPGAAVTVRITGAAIITLIPALIALRDRWHLVRANTGLIIAFGMIAVAACQLFFFNAVTHLSVGVALLLEYLGPVLVVAWLWARHGQRPRAWTMAGMALTTGGLVLLLDLAGGVRIDLVGVLWGLAAAVCLAVYFVLSAREATGLPPLVMAAGGMVVAALVLIGAGLVGVMPMAYGSGDVMLAGHQVTWVVPVLGLCLVAAALAYALGIASTRRLGPRLASFLGLSEVLFAILFAWLLLDELPLPVQLVGGALIVTGVLAVRYDELSGARPDPSARDGGRDPDRAPGYSGAQPRWDSGFIRDGPPQGIDHSAV